jgi:uncharacterized protein YggE
MNKKFSLTILGILLFGLLAACSPTASESANNVRSMNVSGTGRVSIVPDLATINIGVRTEENEVADALSGNTNQANAISEVLQDLGIAKEDIQTSNFNVYPADRYNPMTGEVEGRYFVVENTVNVKVHDLSSLGDVLSAVVDAGANNIYGINFSIEDRESAVAEARSLAIADAKAKAEAIADAAGVKLGDLISINVYEGSAPITYFDAKGGAYSDASVPISAGTLTIVIECNLTYELQ